MGMHSVEMYTPPAGRREGRQSLQMILPHLRGWGKKILLSLPMAGGFFLLSIAQCFSVPSPYAVCCLAALRAAKAKTRGALAGLAAGLLFRVLWGMPWDVWQFAACLLCYPLAKIEWKKTGHLCLMVGALLLARALPEIAGAAQQQTILLHAAGVLLGMVSMPALHRAAGLMQQKKREWSQDDLLCLLLPGLLLIAGSGRLWGFGVNLGYLASILLVLLLAWVAGGAAGICGGMGCGIALLLSGQSALLLVNLAFGALIAGLFQGKNRLLAAGGFLLAAVTATYLIAFSFQAPLFYAALAGGLIFAFLPGKWMRRLGIFVRGLRWAQPRENAYMRLKMQHWVRAIDCMADALPHPRMEEPSAEEESEAVTEMLCADCDRLPICWRDQYNETKAGMQALAERGEDAEDYLAVINQYFSACPRISRIPGLLSNLDLARQKRAQRAICADYERDMLQTHLTALSQAAQRISLEGMNPDGEEEYWMAQVEEALQGLRFPGKAAFVKRIDGRMTVCLRCEPLSLRPVAGETLARHIGVRLNAVLEVTEKQNGRILLEEEPPLMIVTGMATACAVTADRRRKIGKSVDNGDAVMVRPLTGGRMLLALSDGMGHGAGAQDESRKTLELLSLCMEAGYTRGQAMTAVNGMMLSATGGEKFATVDLCLVDLWNGEAYMNKLGACVSVLFQGQKTQLIEGAALPLGIIEHVVPMEHHFTLGEGDLLLMMSDGITDAFGAEDEILSVLRRSREDTPQHIADALLQEALIQKDGLPPDDMTVLCARVASRHPERRKREEN